MRSAIRTKAPKYELAVADDSFAERMRAGLGNVVPVEILNTAAAVADEVVVPHTGEVKTSGSALDGHFTYQSCLHQISQIVVGCRSGRAWVHLIHSFENFRRCGMLMTVHEKGHYGVPLRGTPQPAILQRPFNRSSIHWIYLFRIYLI